MGVLTLTGNYAVAWAVKRARVQVVAAYPITPQTTIVEKISQMVENGELNAKLIRVESEHSALAATFGAAIGGARAFTATASHGLLYMHEVLWWTAGARVPVVMAVVTRAIGPPWNIWTDHSDIMGQRDTGWIIAMAEDNQEAFDLTLQAFKITEDDDVNLPMIVGLDAFILSHTYAPVDVLEQEDVDRWLPPRRQLYVIDPKNRYSMGNIAYPKDYMLMRYDIERAMERAKKVIERIDREYREYFGRRYGGLIECYRCDNAKYLVALMGAWAGDAKEAVDKLRENGYNIGVLRIRFVRPLGIEKILEYSNGKKGIIVMDRSISFGSAGPLFIELSSVLSANGKPPAMKGVLAGIGGVDVGYKDIMNIASKFVNEVEEKGWFMKRQEWFFKQ